MKTGMLVGLLCVYLLALGHLAQHFNICGHGDHLEAHDWRLNALEGYEGTKAMHDRLTSVQLDMLRLERELAKLQKPTGSPGNGDRP